jgi:hypothetical protein
MESKLNICTPPSAFTSKLLLPGRKANGSLYVEKHGGVGATLCMDSGFVTEVMAGGIRVSDNVTGLHAEVNKIKAHRRTREGKIFLTM